MATSGRLRKRGLARRLLRTFGHICLVTHPRRKGCQALRLAEKIFSEFDEFDFFEHRAPEEVTHSGDRSKKRSDNKDQLRRAVRIVATGAGAGALMRGLLGIASKKAAVKQAQGIVRHAPGGVTRQSARTAGRGGMHFKADTFRGNERRRKLALSKVLGFWPGEPGGGS